LKREQTLAFCTLLEQEMFQQKQHLMSEAVSEVEAFITRNNEYISAIVNKMLSDALRQSSIKH